MNTQMGLYYLPIFVLEEFQEHLDDFPFRVVIELNRVFLKLSHEIVRSHEPEVLVARRHFLEQVGDVIRHRRHLYNVNFRGYLKL